MIITDEKFEKLCEDVAVIKSKLSDFPKSFSCDTHGKEIKDHETRLRKLENYTARFIGAIIFGNVLVGIIVAIVTTWITTGKIQ
jgi:hypothetical protein